VSTSGGASRTTSGAAASTGSRRRARRLDGGGDRLGQDDAEPQPEPADLLHERVAEVLDAAPQPVAELGAASSRPVLLDGAQHRERRGADDRVAAEGGAVVAPWPAPSRPGRWRRPRRAGGPPPSALASVTTSGTTPGAVTVLVSHDPDAPDAALHLVEVQQRAVRVAASGRPRGSRPAARRRPASPSTGSSTTDAVPGPTARAGRRRRRRART
jgi:hypothetical protein